MKKLTDQELDRLFKHAAEGYEPSFDQAAWEVMNARLEQPKTVLWKQWIPFALLGLVIFSTGVWVGSRLSDDEKSENSLLGRNQSKLRQSEIAIAEQNQSTALKRSNDRDQRVSILNQDTTRQISISKAVRNDTEINSAFQASANNAYNELDIESGMIESIPVKEYNTQSTNKNLKITDVLAIVQVKEENDSIQKISEAMIEEDTTQSVSEMDKADGKVQNAHSFYFRLLASPDFSSINYSSPNESGSNYAVLLAYQLSNRWSISSGGIWSFKKYSTDQEVAYGSYTADSMVGACRVLDIPINIYYRFFPQSKFSMFSGIGLSSYIMLEEDYTYTFNYPSGSQSYSFNFEKRNNEWFKMLNVSIGAEYQLSKRIFLQAEPFLKAPLNGIGEWDVKLSSVGVFMGIKYKLY
jgi:hypothetical protein